MALLVRFWHDVEVAGEVALDVVALVGLCWFAFKVRGWIYGQKYKF